MLVKAIAFIKRDFRIESSYKLAFVLGILGSIFPVISYFFVGRLMEGHNTESLLKYGGNYFSFSLIGIAFTGYFTLAIRTFTDSIRRAQMAGCLEAILSSQTSPKSVVFMSSLYGFISSGVTLIIMFSIAIFFLGFNLSHINILSFAITLLLSLIVFISIGILSAAGTIIFKQGDPFQFLFGALSALIGGAVFPVSILPNWLKSISMFVPITHSLDALRLTMLKGAGISDVSDSLLLLGGMAVILFPLSLQVFHWAVNKGKKDGTLMQY